MSRIEQTLKRLAENFTVKDIMIPREKLVHAPTEATARRLLEENPDFDVIPIEQKGTLLAYFERGSEHQKYISVKDIISDGTSILSLVEILKDRTFCFVLVDRSVAGYVHFSDLDNHIVKIPFFVILQAVEEHVAEKVRPHINENNLEEVLDKEKTQRLKEKMESLRKKKANLGLVSELSFYEILQFARHFSEIKLQNKELDVISKVRNLICHGTNQLVEGPEDVGRLSEAKYVCYSLLEDVIK